MQCGLEINEKCSDYRIYIEKLTNFAASGGADLKASREYSGKSGKEYFLNVHAGISEGIMAGIDIMTLKELLGHSTIKTTMRYAHLSPSHKQTAVEILGTRLQPKQGVLNEVD